eukprot:3473223-Prymnesium_polylepis.1
MGRGRRNRPFMNTPFMNTFTLTFVHGSRFYERPPPPIRPLNDTYLVPDAPQSRVALEYRLTAHHRP